jgi:hypothetical protein
VQAAESTPERRHPGSPRKRVVARAVHVDGAAIGLYRRRQRLQVGPAGRAQRLHPLAHKNDRVPAPHPALYSNCNLTTSHKCSLQYNDRRLESSPMHEHVFILAGFLVGTVVALAGVGSAR